MTESAWLQTPLFAGISSEDADKLLSCLQGERKRFQKGEMICRAGEQARALGLVLSGAAHIESCDAWGNRSLLGVVMPGQIFAEVYACVPEAPMLVNVIAAEPVEALFLSSGSGAEFLPHDLPLSCAAHAQSVGGDGAEKSAPESADAVHCAPHHSRAADGVSVRSGRRAGKPHLYDSF